MHRILVRACGLARVRIGLRDQMALLGISGVFVTGVICAVALHYASLVQNEATDSDRFKAHVAFLSQSFLESRQIATEFLRKPSEVLIKKYAENHERQLAALARLESFAAGLPDDDPLRQATSLRPVINLYATRFQNVVAGQRNLGFDEDDGFQGKLRNDVHAVEQRLSELNATRLTILMLMMRRHEKDFILRGDDKYGDQLAEREAEFETVLARDSLAQEIKSQILERIRAYKGSFVSFAATQQVLHDQVDDLEQIYDRIRPTLVQILAAADAHSEAVESRAEQFGEISSGSSALQPCWWGYSPGSSAGASPQRSVR